MPFTVVLTGDAPDELRRLRVFERRRLTEEMKKHLVDEPTVQTRNRKRLDGLSPSFEHIPPVWELRVGDLRVFYDVDADEEKVFVRAIRRKAHGEMTEEVT
jgi:mRNA-degrading endonuclease RelE of RelBE toxin-antitoxin system